MFTSPSRRPLLLAAASVALVTVTACGAQAATRTAPAPTGYTALAHRAGHCGEGGEGGKGGAPGRPGQPGKPGKPGCFSLRDLPDKPTSELSRLDKARIALAVLTGRVTRSDAAKKYRIAEKEISAWERQLLNGDWLAFLQPESS
ncbi:hypothetical protein SRB17_27540 [Streptomyces sp. RB17]|uniref:DUF1153 domain-containing protein n=1 Tax=Streptomyces sp. RB17 TaxID=2585197 RepID=UPI00129681E6|nr:DUF1153 domain-containing protein [Streptomyces sp. RB17]MQY34784.1 hypothetical protein [Streptomyces sp. RB17]